MLDVEGDAFMEHEILASALRTLTPLLRFLPSFFYHGR